MFTRGPLEGGRRPLEGWGTLGGLGDPWRVGGLLESG